ncbi:hypothetical protein GOBAR_AA05300 [Gossypium barbadense]|uniref:Uncharacterized protein n=1 Tax=Gossypium barbadense TaxID=3634 RepID=A0A2P5YI82_GOSBA|nr:hypothetical protein GOBAR_AA05300 [Gossypium barbadense]
MLTKFILVSETHFQNTETALKNQQASIQGLKTQIGQLSKLISEQPQRSLPSNTEPNPREQLNVINVQDEEGFVEPEPEPRGPIQEDRRLQIEELDEWQMHKPRTPNKLNLRQNKLNPFPNQHKVGDRVLLDTLDPHIFTTTSNEENPLMVLRIFLFGMIEVSHPKFGTFKGRVKIGQQIFPNTGYDKTRRGRATWPWSNLPKQHGVETRPCGRTVGEPVKIARLFDTPVSSTRGRTCYIDTSVGLNTRAW